MHCVEVCTGAGLIQFAVRNQLQALVSHRTFGFWRQKSFHFSLALFLKPGAGLRQIPIANARMRHDLRTPVRQRFEEATQSSGIKPTRGRESEEMIRRAQSPLP